MPTSMHSVDDRRFTLTDSERQAVNALKDACDKEQVEYKHIFELAKYVLVTHSMADDTNPEAPKIRLNAAVKRIKKRNAWLKKHGMDSVNPATALAELSDLYPNYFVNKYTKDRHGHVAVAHHHAYPPTDFVCSSKENLAKYLAAEQFRLDLGAADMEEARQGICMVSVTEGQLSIKRAYKYIRLVTKAAENLKDMHPNRIKQIYSEVPSFLTYLVGPAKALLPRKISARINVVGSMDELNKFLEQNTTMETSTNDWLKERLVNYNETVTQLDCCFETHIHNNVRG